MIPAARRAAARVGIRQVEVSLKADGAADAVDLAIVRLWQQLLLVIKEHGTSPARVYHAALALLRQMPNEVISNVARSLDRQARWGARTTAQALTQALPKGSLQYVAANQQATEAQGDHVDPDLFPPQTSQQVDSIVYQGDWQQRLASGTKLGNPDQLAMVVAAGVAAGKTHQQIAKDLLPHVQQVKASARRIARTESLRVANETQLQTYDALGDLVIGYQIHATMDQHTRPAHAARNGTIYYKAPKAGQKGLDEMPRPPHEADGSVAWNCRCYLSPVMVEPEHLAQGDTSAFATQDGPDPVVYSEWFDQADEKRRRLAVGTGRYSLVADQIAGKPQWEHFIDPIGKLLTKDQLRQETPKQRQQRVEAVKQAQASQRADKVTVSTYGYLPGTAPKPLPAPPVAKLPEPTQNPPSVPIAPPEKLQPIPEPAPAPAPATSLPWLSDEQFNAIHGRRHDLVLATKKEALAITGGKETLDRLVKEGHVEVSGNWLLGYEYSLTDKGHAALMQRQVEVTRALAPVSQPKPVLPVPSPAPKPAPPTTPAPIKPPSPQSPPPAPAVTLAPEQPTPRVEIDLANAPQPKLPPIEPLKVKGKLKDILGAAKERGWAANKIQESAAHAQQIAQKIGSTPAEVQAELTRAGYGLMNVLPSDGKPDPGNPAPPPPGKANGKLPKESRPQLTAEEAGALARYTDHDFSELNRAIRNTGAPPPDMQKHYDRLQSAFERTPTMSEPVTVYRGVGIPGKQLATLMGKYATAMQTGKPVQLGGFVSTTTKRGVVTGEYDGNVICVINACHGLDAKPVSFNADEDELLLPHDAKFIVREVKKQKNGKYLVQLDQLPPKR